jgi:hypothetical protein
MLTIVVHVLETNESCRYSVASEAMRRFIMILVISRVDNHLAHLMSMYMNIQNIYHKYCLLYSKIYSL